MASFTQTIGAISAARSRRTATALKEIIRIEWFITQVSNKVRGTMRQRIRVATALLKNHVVNNISTEVIKSQGPRGGTIVTGRSKRGEFPHADTLRLMRSIISGTVADRTGPWGWVGTTEEHGLLLETKMNRSFLVRTLNEQRGNIVRILTGPIR